MGYGMEELVSALDARRARQASEPAVEAEACASDARPGGGCVLQIWIDGQLGNAARRFYLVETQFPDLDAFLSAADADCLLRLLRIDTGRGDEPGDRVVWRRVPVAIRGRALRMACLPMERLVERA